MPLFANNTAGAEEGIASQIDALASGSQYAGELTALLREDHPFYQDRGTATVVSIRGWVLVSLARTGLTDDALLFVLEELETGLDPYLVAAAANALRSYPTPKGAFAPFVLRALKNMMGHDEPVSFAQFGDYALSANSGTSPVRELIQTLRWLGHAAQSVLPEVRALRTPAFPGKLVGELEGAIDVIAGATPDETDVARRRRETCCNLPGGLGGVVAWARQVFHPDEPVVLEDHQGARLSFEQLFVGHPTIAVFFYTRCDNPLKCSLSITKLGRIQKLLKSRGLADRIHTAAITYDPGFDLPARMRVYGERRGFSPDSSNRMLRTIDGMASMRRHFKLGVGFVGSVVNRHRIEAYILDDRGRIAYSFERLPWDEAQLVDTATAVLKSATGSVRAALASGTLGPIASIGLAVFPKCPVCWTAYLGVLGIAGLERILYIRGVEILLAGAALINLASVWLRTRTTHRVSGAWLVTAGVALIALSRFGWPLATWGVSASLIGSMLSAFLVRAPRST